MNSTWASGDKLGIEIIGSTIRMMQYTGGAWIELASRTDLATYTAAGYIGFDVGTNSVRMIDFGGGTVVVPPPAPVESVSYFPNVWVEILDNG